jgi:hypothetical protein
MSVLSQMRVEGGESTSDKEEQDPSPQKKSENMFCFFWLLDMKLIFNNFFRVRDRIRFNFGGRRFNFVAARGCIWGNNQNQLDYLIC